MVWAGAIEALLVLLFLRPAWRPEVFSQLGDLSGRYAWIGTLGNPADIATFLALPALLAAERALAARRRRLLWAGAAILLAGVLLGTRTITAALALAAGGFVLAWRAGSRRWRVPLVAGVAVAAVLLFVLTPLAGRIRTAFAEAKHGGVVWLGSARGAAFLAAGSMIEARPLTGVGFGLFEADSFRFQSPETLADRGRVLGLVTGFGEAHNEVLQHAAETGLLGIALAAAGFALALRRGRTGGAGLLDPVPLVAAALVVALAEFPLHLAATAAQWAVLAALALPPLPPPPVDGSRGRSVPACWRSGSSPEPCSRLAWQRYRAGTAFEQAKVLVSTLRAAPARSPVKIELARAALANLQRWSSGGRTRGRPT